MSVPLAVEGMDALALAQEGERLCRENNMKAGIASYCSSMTGNDFIVIFFGIMQFSTLIIETIGH